MNVPAAVKRFFSPPPAKGEDGARVSLTVVTVSSAILIGLVVLLAYRIAAGAWVNFAEIATLGTMVLFALALVHRRQERVSAAFLTWSLLAFIEYMIWKNDGLHDTALLALPGVLVLGSIVLRRTNFTLLTGAMLASLCALGALETCGVLVSRYSGGTTVADVLDLLVMTGVTGVAVRTLADTYLKNFARLQHSERELRRQSEQLVQSEIRHRTLFESGPDAVLILKGERFIDCNAVALEMFGDGSGAAILDATPWEVSPPLQPDGRSSMEKGAEIIAAALAGTPARFLWKHRRRDGTLFDAEVSLNRIDAGDETLLQAIVRDVTQRTLMEGALRQSEERFARLADASFEGIAVTEQGRVVDVNPQLARMLGYEPLEMIGMLISRFVAPESRDLVAQRVRSDNDEPYEHLALRKDGSVFPVEVRARSIAAQGETVRLTAIRDMSERRKLEEDLRVIRRAVEQSPASIVITDTAGAIQYANPKFLDLTGFGVHEVLGKNPRILKSGVTPQENYASLWATITGGGVWRGEFCNRKKNGDLYWEDAAISGVTNDAGSVTHFVAVKVDITERKQAELALERSEQRYRDLVEQLPDGVYRSTHEGRFLEVNPALVRILGYANREDLMAVDIPSQLYFDPADREATITTEMNEEMAIYCLRRKDGSGVWVEDHGRYVLGTGGAVLFHEGILRDVTDRLRAEDERKRLEEELFQAQKMESIGTMAAGLAHDFNNILNVIIGNADLMKALPGVPDAGRRRVESIAKASERGAQLVKKLMTFARKTDIVERPLALNDLIREAIDLVRTTMPRGIEIRLALGGDVPEIVGDAGQLQQVLMNFCVNARDAMPSGGTLTIATSSLTGDEVRAAFPSAAAERYARVAVADTGSGMDEATRSRIFDPFFTTKKPDRGTGLGLAVVSGIVSKHRGFLDVRTAPGKGSEFAVMLPVSRQAPASPGQA